MKSISPSNSEPATGRQYWRSLDELAETPEFREWIEREFPQGASEFNDPVSRRHFVKIMSASFMLAGLGIGATGCRRPVEKLEPFGKQPDDYVFGTSHSYATAMPRRYGAIPLVVKSYEGRPIKIEGNAQFPGGNGGTDRWAQASILDVYDPDRARRFTKGGNNVSREEALDFLGQLSKKFAANQGEGLAFLIEPNTSPSRMRLREIIRQKFPKAKWWRYEPIRQRYNALTGLRIARTNPLEFTEHYDVAKVILSLDCDFIGSEENAHENIRQFVQGRKIEKPSDSMNRLYIVESLFTLTGLNADHRLRIPASAVVQVASAMAAEVARLTGTDASIFERVGKPSEVDPKWILECAKDLANNKGQSLVVAGYRQSRAVRALANALNGMLGNFGKSVKIREPIMEFFTGSTIGLTELATALSNGEVDTLVMLGANPVHSAPPDLNWTQAQAKTKSVVRLGYHEDETFEASKRADDWHFPLAHYLESWGDALTSDRTLVPIQPLIQPLFGGLTELEVLARIAGESVTSPYEIVRATFANYRPAGVISASSPDQLGTEVTEDTWRKFLYDGFHTGSKPSEFGDGAGAIDPDEVARIVGEVKANTPSKENLEVIFHRDYSVDDGCYANNGWLQEFPDPITKISWDNAVLMSRKTARELDLKNEDVIEVKLGNRTVSGPVWIQPGMADYSLGLALGYGREKAGRVGTGVGFNAYALRSSETEHIAVGATVRKLDRTFEIACVQHHWSMEGRPIVREANLEQFRQHPDFARKMDLPEPPVVAPLYPNPLDKTKQNALHQWGMSIDLNSCVGCGTCVIACQSENNVPIVGKDQVRRGREMHWMRIDRYYAADPAAPRIADWFKTDKAQEYEEWIDNPQTVVQPMLCQHCEAAPCESVCPVNATTHSDDGLNLMVYNRCVGTRYCSNNCPYKVRRFNFLDFNKRPLNELKGPFYSSALTHRTERQWDLLRWLKDPTSPTAGMRPEEEWDLIKMSKNPDVSVRMRGVMEKCTMCVQRIEEAKIAQKVKARNSGDVKLRESEGTVPETACQQACPANAIVFGDLTDPESRVSKLKQQERDYTVLENLYTRPRLTYLARVRNPNPAMPDYTEGPMSFEEFKGKMGDPFESEGGSEAPAVNGKEHAHG